MCGRWAFFNCGGSENGEHSRHSGALQSILCIASPLGAGRGSAAGSRSCGAMWPGFALAFITELESQLPILEAQDIPPNIRASFLLRPGSIFLPALRVLAYKPSGRILILRGQDSPLSGAMEENKVVHKRILDAITPSRELNSAKFDNRRRAVPCKLIRMIYLVDAVGIEPTTCRLRADD